MSIFSMTRFSIPSTRLRPADFAGLALFHEDYPQAERILIYGGDEEKVVAGIKIVPAERFFREIDELLGR